MLCLSALLMACGPSGGNTPPDTGLETFFRTQPAFGGPLPGGARPVTPAEFRRLVESGATVITDADLTREAEAQRAQDRRDEEDARADIRQFPEFAALLEPNAPGAINADGDRLAGVEVGGGTRPVTVASGTAFSMNRRVRSSRSGERSGRSARRLPIHSSWVTSAQRTPISPAAARYISRFQMREG